MLHIISLLFLCFLKSGSGCPSLSSGEAAEAMNFVIRIAHNLADLNKDGLSTIQESKQSFCDGQCNPQNNEILEKANRGADTNGDGGASLHEMGIYLRDGLTDYSSPTLEEYYRLIFTYMDTNEDGELSRGDFGMLQDMCSDLAECQRLMPRFDCDTTETGFFPLLRARTTFQEMMSVVRKGQSGINL